MASPLKSKVKVGPFRFKFVETNLNVTGNEETFHYGVTHLNEATSYIHADQDPGIKKETYFHEMLHVACLATGLSERLGEEEEEKLIQTLSPILLDVLQSNPEFTSYILESE